MDMFAAEERRPIARILVTDDNAQNRKLAEALLVSEGYAVVLAEDGEQALAAFNERTPDLVLLDVLMPLMDGFETCKRIRALRGGTDVAIVFLTALNDLATHQRSIASGADDFLTKPIQRTELLMRVRSLLWVKRLKDELRQGYDLIRSQRDALLTAQRQKEELTALIVHDLKNLLTGVTANAQFLATTVGLPDEIWEAARDVFDSSKSMQRMVMNLLDISLSEDGALVPQWSEVDLSALAEEVRSEYGRRVGERKQTLEISTGTEGRVVRADRDLLRRLLENLLDNAIRYSPTGGKIRVEIGSNDTPDVDLRIKDEGPGVPGSHRERIFDKYVRLERDVAAALRGSRGLGLAFCRLAAEVHGGRIWVEDNLPRGSTFCVRLPRTQ